MDNWKQKRPGYGVSGAERNIIENRFFLSFFISHFCVLGFSIPVFAQKAPAGRGGVELSGLLYSANRLTVDEVSVCSGSVRCRPCGQTVVLLSTKRIVKIVNTTIFCSV